MGGSEAGNGIKDVLYGDYNPSGRLPYTIARNDGDYPAQLVLDSWTPNYPVVIPYTEGCVSVSTHTAVLRILLMRWLRLGSSSTTVGSMLYVGGSVILASRLSLISPTRNKLLHDSSLASD